MELRSRKWKFWVSLLAFSVIFGLSFLLDAVVADYMVRPISSGQIKAVMRAMRCWGEGATLFVIAIGVGFACRDRWKEPIVWVLVTLICATTVVVIKPLFFRVRPSQLAADSPDAPEKWNSSFPSGHTATAFAFARCLSASFPAVTPICVLAAAGTAGSRMYDQRHYFSDCVAGAALGWWLASLLMRWLIPLTRTQWNMQTLFSRQPSKTANSEGPETRPATSMSG